MALRLVQLPATEKYSDRTTRASSNCSKALLSVLMPVGKDRERKTNVDRAIQRLGTWAAQTDWNEQQRTTDIGQLAMECNGQIRQRRLTSCRRSP